MGLIEKGAKAIVLIAVGTQRAGARPAKGMILGAIVGAAFAAFESYGYALRASSTT